MLAAELDPPELRKLLGEVNEPLADLFDELLGKPRPMPSMAFDAKPELSPERVRRVIKKYNKGQFSEKLNRVLEAAITLMEDGEPEPTGRSVQMYHDWMLEKVKREFEVTGKTIKRDNLLEDCMNGVGATWREALAAYHMLPEEYTLKRGKPKKE
jgi:hypothetical protein